MVILTVDMFEIKLNVVYNDVSKCLIDAVPNAGLYLSFVSK